jgi:hypothetical protein
VGIDDIPVGPEMFERWIGATWGIRAWRVFFSVVVLGIVGGVLFGGWKAVREVHQEWGESAPSKAIVKTVRVTVPTPDPAQAETIRELQAKLAFLEAQGALQHVAPPKPTIGNITTGSGSIVAPNMSGGTNTLVTQAIPEWHLTNSQAQKLGPLLEAVSEKDRFKLTIHDVPSSNHSGTFAADLVRFFTDHRWEVERTDDFTLSPSVAGVHVAVDSAVKTAAEIPPNAILLLTILNASGLMNSRQADPFDLGDAKRADILVGAEAAELAQK